MASYLYIYLSTTYISKAAGEFEFTWPISHAESFGIIGRDLFQRYC